jgi:hypothetical protein
MSDNATMTLPGVQPAQEPQKRGRKPIYANKAEQQAAYRARNNIKPLTVQLPVELHAEFEAFLKAKGKKPSAVIVHLLRTQLLRKR